MSDQRTCEDCLFHLRESGDRWQKDWCYWESGEPVLRQSRSEYWAHFPLACSHWTAIPPDPKAKEIAHAE